MKVFSITTAFPPLIINPASIFIFFLLPNDSLCVDPRFEACSAITSCGKIQNISYPFYVDGQQPPYCGYPYPGFKLVCDVKNRTILKLSDNDNPYVVKEILYGSKSVRVSNIASLDSDSEISCSPPIQNLTLKTDDHFELQSGFLNLSLYFSCSESALQRLEPYKITCFEADNGTDFGLAMFQFDLKLNLAIAGCGNGMKVPVQVYNNESGLESREWSYYARLIERGFVMKWNSTDCSRCLVSGGKCGYDLTGTTFQCFCPDRPHNAYCSEGGNGFNMLASYPSDMCLPRLTQQGQIIKVVLRGPHHISFATRSLSNAFATRDVLPRGGFFRGAPPRRISDLPRAALYVSSRGMKSSL